MKKCVFMLALFFGISLITACPTKPSSVQETPAAVVQESPEVEDEEVSQPPAPRPKDGIYVGIITFGHEAEDITGGSPVYLDAEGLDTVNNLLSSIEVESTIGTALFHAAHLALANMTRAKPMLPQDLGVVAMVTFTDGLDVSSTGLGLPAVDDPGNVRGLRFAGEDLRRYQYFIRLEIHTRRINDTPISAFIAAVRGDDVTDIAAFDESLRSLASNDDNILRDTDMQSVGAMLGGIADRIVEDLTTRSFVMITPQYPRGARVRMTFNGESNSLQAQNAQRYIEGEIAIQDNRYYLINITYGGGIRASTSDRIAGTIERGALVFDFPNFTGYDLNQSREVFERDLRKWVISPGEREWQVNSEYSPSNEVNKREVKNNALIYLVLDMSSSIDPSDIPMIQDSAKAFIRRLYDEHNRPVAD